MGRGWLVRQVPPAKDRRTMSTDVLLALLVLVGLFCAYELAAIKLHWFPHTISWYAKHNRWLYRVILALFVVGGLVGAGWWYWHIHYGTIVR
jgi:H+/Cl- antiporter ClcA